MPSYADGNINQIIIRLRTRALDQGKNLTLNLRIIYVIIMKKSGNYKLNSVTF